MKNKKLFLLIGAASIIAVTLALTVQVGATNVVIDPNLSVTPHVISFETVFPGEVHFKPLTVSLSDEFIESAIHDDVEYRIVQRTKPRIDTPEEREYCGLFPNDLSRCYPSLCPYLSKTADSAPPNDTSIPSFHNPADPTSIAKGRLAKSDNDLIDDWVIDLHTPCFKGQCDQTNSVPPEYQLDPELEGQIFGCDLVVEVVDISFFNVCPNLCELKPDGSPVYVEVNNDITIDFKTNPPTYNGDPVLLPYFSYDISSTTPAGWKAIFTMGSKSFQLKPGAEIRTIWDGGGNWRESPGIEVKTDCKIFLRENSGIIVSSRNRDAGDILLKARAKIVIDGKVVNEQTGSQDRPGNITIANQCGDILIERTGFIDDSGGHAGARDINILSCTAGNIVVDGLVFGRATVNSSNPKSQPDIRVSAFGGGVTINANTPQPLYPNFGYAGAHRDLWGGLLSLVVGHSVPGAIQVQARDDINVNGHGQGQRQSYGAIATKTVTNAASGGVIDVRSLAGEIIGRDRAFDVRARNTQLNIASIKLFAKEAISLMRLGANNNFNPVVDGAATNGNGIGAVNIIRSYEEGITNGALALVTADSAGTDGTNNLTSCTGVTNNGTINPADLNVGDNSGSCAVSAPAPIWSSCGNFGITF